MAKRITAKIDEYQKDGQTKGKYVEIGVILSNQNGEYILLNPTIDLAGVLMRQRLLAQQTGKNSGTSVMCSIFDNDNQGYQQQGGQQGQANPSGQHQQNPNYVPPAGNMGGQQGTQPPQNQGNFDDDIPF